MQTTISGVCCASLFNHTSGIGPVSARGSLIRPQSNVPIVPMAEMLLTTRRPLFPSSVKSKAELGFVLTGGRPQETAVSLVTGAFRQV